MRSSPPSAAKIPHHGRERRAKILGTNQITGQRQMPDSLVVVVFLVVNIPTSSSFALQFLKL
jgi:hypothetical protein